ncbi:MAG: domain containing protein [Rhodospirillales bacterium]|nr:domain containing protein [Rhodospirillales bacterium]
MKIGEIMTRDVEIANPDDTLQTAARLMADLNSGILPVGENDRLVGVVNDRDIAIRGVAQGLDPTTTAIRQIMTSELRYCFEDDTVDDVSRKMGEWQVRRLPVLNSDKRLVGIVSLGDMVLEADDAEPAKDALHSISQPADEAAAAYAGDKPKQ